MEKMSNVKDKETGRVIGGLILVGVGAALLLRNMGFFMPRWLFTWPVILILVGIYLGFKHNFRNNAWIVLIAVGGFFLVSKFIPDLSLEPLFWPLVIIGAGVLFILKPTGKKWQPNNPQPAPNNWSNVSMDAPLEPVEFKATSLDSTDYLEIKSVFSGVKRHVMSKDFKGGKISSVFGGAEIDFRQADINGQVILKLEVAFGGVKLVVPPHWAVQNNVDGVFHGIEDNRGVHHSSTVNPEKLLILTGSAVFGGVEIKSY